MRQGSSCVQQVPELRWHCVVMKLNFSFHPFSGKREDSASYFVSLHGFLIGLMIKKPRGKGTTLKAKGFCAACLAVLGLAALVPNRATATPAGQCQRVVMHGMVDAGHEWSQSFGQGWVFRVVPIKDYSGWDLAVDRSGGAGFPDALLLATPPYESISQREVGTTFGIRAQDAIGWNPRSFRFFTNPTMFRKAQNLYFELRGKPDANRHGRNAVEQVKSSKNAGGLNAASKSLSDMLAQSAAGQFRIVDARLTPGTANALPYAQNWALQQRNTPHTIVATTSPTPYGELHSLQFEITLWLPEGWKAPTALRSTPAPCE